MNPSCSRNAILLCHGILEGNTWISKVWFHCLGGIPLPFQVGHFRMMKSEMRPEHSLIISPMPYFMHLKFGKKNNAYGISWRQIKSPLSPEAAALSEVLKIGQNHQKMWKNYCLPLICAIYRMNRLLLAILELSVGPWSILRRGNGKGQSLLFQVLSDETYLCKTV